MSPDVTVQVHLFGHLNDNSTLPTDASLAGLGEPPFSFPVLFAQNNEEKTVKSRQSNSFSFCNWRQRVQHGLCHTFWTHCTPLHTSHLDCPQFDSSWDSFEQKCIMHCFKNTTVTCKEHLSATRWDKLVLCGVCKLMLSNSKLLPLTRADGHVNFCLEFSHLPDHHHAIAKCNFWNNTALESRAQHKIIVQKCTIWSKLLQKVRTIQAFRSNVRG